MSFDKAAFFAAVQQLPIDRVDLPEIGLTVYVRAMSGVERDAWEKSLLEGRGKNQRVNTDNVRAKLVAKVTCDEKGERVFTDADAVELGKGRVDVLNRIFSKAQELSGVSDKDVEELGKGSAPAAGNDSSSS